VDLQARVHVSNNTTHLTRGLTFTIPSSSESSCIPPRCATLRTPSNSAAFLICVKKFFRLTSFSKRASLRRSAPPHSRVCEQQPMPQHGLASRRGTARTFDSSYSSRIGCHLFAFASVTSSRNGSTRLSEGGEETHTKGTGRAAEFAPSTAWRRRGTKWRHAHERSPQTWLVIPHRHGPRFSWLCCRLAGRGNSHGSCRRGHPCHNVVSSRTHQAHLPFAPNLFQ